MKIFRNHETQKLYYVYRNVRSLLIGRYLPLMIAYPYKHEGNIIKVESEKQLRNDFEVVATYNRLP